MNKPPAPRSLDSLRGFWSLFVTQFQGAFNDNVLKNLVIFMLIGMNVSLGEKHRISELVGALFSLPFILFSMAGGFLADRFSKRTMTVCVKIFEVCVMSFALAGFAFHQLPILLAAVFLMGVHSAFFGPSKYGLLPELLPEKKLSWGNGLLELGTFVAIILGTVAAAYLSEHYGRNQVSPGAILVALAFAGLATSLGITRVPAADPGRKFKANFVREVFRQLREIRGDRPLILALMGNIYFTFLGALVLLNLFFYGANVLRVDAIGIGKLNIVLALGIGLGSAAAGYLSGGKIEYGLVPLGALGLSLVSVLLAVPGLSVNGALVRLALLGFLGGFFIVPVSALLQHRPDKEKKGEVLAAANLLSFVGAFLASGTHYVLAQALRLSPLQIFLFGGVLTLAGAAYAVALLPDALLRFVLWALTRTIYRIRVEGRDNIPEKGGALFVCNHVSLVDALLLLASTDRRVRFMMFKAHYELPCIRPFARILGVIPISSEQRPREMIKSLQTASDAIRAGDVVCIFAEGQITRIGHLLPFRRGFERIMKDLEAPIIPVALDGVWGSIFSFEKGRFLWKVPRRLPYPVTVNYGKPMPHTGTPFEVRQAVQELLAEAWRDRKARMKPLHRAFVRTARLHPFRFAMADAQHTKVSFGSALVRTVFLARRLKSVWAGQKMVGLLLPPSVPGALVNFAAMLMGKVPVNLNYTLPEETLASCIRQCEIKTVLSSRAFLEKLKLKLPCGPVFLEEVVRAKPPDQPLTRPADTLSHPPSAVLLRRTSRMGEGRGEGPPLFEVLVAAALSCLPAGLLERVLGGGSSRRKEAHSSAPPPSSDIRRLSLNDSLEKGERDRPGRSSRRLAEWWAEGKRFAPRYPFSRQNVFGQRPKTAGETLALPEITESFPLTRLDDLAAVIFSSGSTGDPKGVLLSHYNIGSNIEQLEQVFGLNRHDRFLGILPFFHSFGFTGTLWLPAVLGVGVVYHANPLDAKIISRLVREYEVTFLLATPTFLQIYMRGCSAEDFGSLRVVMTGAEKLPDRLATAFEEQFGIRPLEGYGCTECAPVVAVNTHDFRAAGFRQIGAKRGKIGHPVPGLSVRIVDPQTMAPVPPGQPGLLLVHGPNVMQGYLGRPDKTAEALVEDISPRASHEAATAPHVAFSRAAEEGARRVGEGSWYITGDIAAIDEDGFLQITDRLSRFSKIGGEMVPHIKVEEKLHELAGATEQTFVVVGVPDDKKGERLVVLHMLADEPLQSLLEKLARSDLANLWKPRPDQFYHVDAFSYLGSGKLDLRKAREMAEERASTEGRAGKSQNADR